MKILIIEDEPPIAEYIEELCHNIAGDKIQSIRIVYSLESAKSFLDEFSIDLCLLDLNLNGKNGYHILKTAVARSFHTIVISAYTDQAFEAFEYGVLDFVPKPFEEERLQAAFDRYSDLDYNKELPTKFLSVKDGQRIKVISTDNIVFFRAADNYVEAVLKNGQIELLDKPLYRLMQILPANFFQIHRSYAIDINQITSFGHSGGGAYQVEIAKSEVLPLSRQKYKALKEKFNL